MHHQTPIGGEVLFLASDYDLRVRYPGRDYGFGANQILQALVGPDAAEKQDQTVIFTYLRLCSAIAKYNVRNDMDVLARKAQILNDYLLQPLAVNNDAGSVTKAKVHDHLWHLLPLSV